MARPLRIEYEGAFYHVIQRGIERRDIFKSHADKEKFLSYLKTSYLAYKAIFHTYVLMDNHYHLTLETPQGNLSKIMHYLNTSYAAYFNAKRKRAGHLYQGRFKAVLVQQDEYLHYLSRYIHLNPVRAGIVKSPVDYPHSSYDFFISDKRKPPEWLNTDFILSMFHKDLSMARRLYKQFVMDNIGKEKEVIENNTKMGCVLGDDGFLQTIKDRLIDRKEDAEIPILKEIKRADEPTLEEVKAVAERHVKNDRRLARSVSMYLSRKYTQKTLNEIAVFYGKIQYTGVSQVCGRMEKRRVENREIEEMLRRVEVEIMKCKV